MARVKGAVTTRARHKKVLKRAKGYFGAKSVRFRMANQAVMKSLRYAYVGRKQNKRNFRKLWIARINAASRMCGTTYSKLMAGLKKANISKVGKLLFSPYISVKYSMLFFILPILLFCEIIKEIATNKKS